MGLSNGDGFLEESEKILDQIQQLIEVSHHQLTNAKNSIQEKLKEKAHKVVDEGLIKIEINIKKVKVQDFSGEVSRRAIDVSGGLEVKNEKYSEQLKSCVSRDLRRSSLLVEEFVEDVKGQVRDLVKDIERKVAECKRKSSPQLCLVQALLGVSAVPNVIIEEIVKLEDLFNNVKWEQCVKKVIANRNAEFGMRRYAANSVLVNPLLPYCISENLY
ncbi:PREDICTED: uncharacterized protein LOC108556540 isoform X2 [Nicrophorus vespilloides]|uniref:Uncharacterized protein LOC108556540 isoform X2 n=1 Tax=Nicrophorus vespilloides TaxID=110193 RepID=A0ABM1M0T3_NICVS|nr:PREDICTED: uncharacterized protein LOC108556540 isoform X2 [Nicrophorus vespilloides]